MKRNYPDSAYSDFERAYLDHAIKIATTGHLEANRTENPAIRTFGGSLRVDLSKGMPAISTKKLHWKTAINEMICFLRGYTNIKDFHKMGVKIWDQWADPETGELGPIYGSLWRDWTSIRRNEDGTFEEVHVDQVANAIKSITENPGDRRTIWHGWDPALLPESGDPRLNPAKGLQALPPCHMTYQWLVVDSKLNLKVGQRSSDTMVGLPFNVFQQAWTLTVMALHTGHGVGELEIPFGDAHIYQDHLDGLGKQLLVEPNPVLPKLVVKTRRENIWDYTADDFELEGYVPGPDIKFKVFT